MTVILDSPVKISTPVDYGIQKISPSGLTLYEKCPLAFYYIVWLGLKLPEPMVHLEFGTSIHLAVDSIYENRNRTGQWGDISVGKKAIDIFKESFKRSYCESDEQFFDMTNDGQKILEEYWDNKDILLAKGVNPVQFEIPGKDYVCNPETGVPLPIPLSYRIDAIGVDHSVIEFKTSSALYDQFETRARPQSLCYVWAYWNKYKVIPTLHYVVMLKKRKKDKLQHMCFTYDMADLMAFDAHVRGVLDKIKNREFSRPLVNHDRFCDCEKYRKALEY